METNLFLICRIKYITSAMAVYSNFGQNFDIKIASLINSDTFFTIRYIYIYICIVYMYLIYIINYKI